MISRAKENHVFLKRVLRAAKAPCLKGKAGDGYTNALWAKTRWNKEFNQAQDALGSMGDKLAELGL